MPIEKWPKASSNFQDHPGNLLPIQEVPPLDLDDPLPSS